MLNQPKDNCLFLYGGGLIDSANYFLRTIIQPVSTSERFEHTYVGRYSFEALLNKSYILEWNKELKIRAEMSHGGYFGTCRGINLTDPTLQHIAIQQCKARGITWVFVAGGDGSSRQVAEIADDFEKAGIKFAFIMPCTVDGIEGGASLGIDMAVKTYVNIIQNFANATLCTRDDRHYSISAVILQGRNRDDLLAHVLQHIVSGPVAGFEPPDIDIFAIPANFEWSREVLSEKVETSEKPILLLISEGATLAKSELHSFFKKKVRIHSIGHLSQANGNTKGKDRKRINYLVNKLLYPNLLVGVKAGRPFSLVVNQNFDFVNIEDIGYFARLNPKNGQHPTLPLQLQTLLEMYIPRKAETISNNSSKDSLN